MTTQVSFTASRRPDGMAVLTVHGEIDLSNAGTFADELAAALPEQGRLTVDLTDVEYLDSAGLTALFARASRIEVIVTPLLAPTLAISGLSDVAIVHERDDGLERRRDHGLDQVRARLGKCALELLG